MIIKKGTKYYKVEKIMTKADVDEYKATLQKHYDTLDTRTAKVMAKIEAEKVENKKKTGDELKELNKLTSSKTL